MHVLRKFIIDMVLETSWISGDLSADVVFQEGSFWINIHLSSRWVITNSYLLLTTSHPFSLESVTYIHTFMTHNLKWVYYRRLLRILLLAALNAGAIRRWKHRPLLIATPSWPSQHTHSGQPCKSNELNFVVSCLPHERWGRGTQSREATMRRQRQVS